MKSVVMKLRARIAAGLAVAVSLVATGAVHGEEIELTVRADQPGDTISKYVYGQFAEHLGRCIYGGIWAEMLEDRKFYYPVTAEYDPYRAARGVAKDSAVICVPRTPPTRFTPTWR